MLPNDEVERFLLELRRTLRLPAKERDRVVAELRAHLADAIADEQSRGAGRDEAVHAALSRIGAARTVAREYRPRLAVLDAVVALGVLACLGVAMWLAIVAQTVVRAEDPGRVGVWTMVGLGYLAYAAVTAAYLVVVRSGRGLPVAVAAAVFSGAAIAAGTALAVPMLLTSGDFEGYIVLMGAVLVGHGVVVIAHVARTGRRVRGIAGS